MKPGSHDPRWWQVKPPTENHPLRVVAAIFVFDLCLAIAIVILTR